MNEHGFSRLTVMYMVVGVLIVAGAVTYALLNNIRSTSNETNTEVPLQVSGVKSINEIRDIAGANLGEGITIISIELEEEDAGLVYKVKLSDGTILFYMATSGEAIIDPSNNNDDNELSGDEDAIPADFVAAVSLAQARSIAENRRPGKVVRKIELEVEHGVVVYSVRFTDEGRVDVNATTGEVVRVKEPTPASSSGSSSTNETEDDDDESGSDQKVEIEVKIEDNIFTGLSALKVNQEARIKVHNEDEVSHTFTISSLGINITVPADSEKEVRFTPTQKGTFAVKCTLHNITSSITVN